MRTDWRPLLVGALMSQAISWGCARVGSSQSPSNGQRPPAPTQKHPSGKIRWKLGQAIDLRIPMVEGTVLELGTLEGRIVIVELSDLDPKQIELAQNWYRKRVLRGPGQVTVIQVVSNDAWIPPVDVPDMRYSWDPDGAIAAVLRSHQVPTTIVIDKQGRLSAVLSCSWPACAKQLEPYLAD